MIYFFYIHYIYINLGKKSGWLADSRWCFYLFGAPNLTFMAGTDMMLDILIHMRPEKPVAKVISEVSWIVFWASRVSLTLLAMGFPAFRRRLIAGNMWVGGFGLSWWLYG